MKYTNLDIEPRIKSAGLNFKLIDTNRFHLPGSKGRFMHIASIHYTVREFIVFLDLQLQKSHIEEITGGHLKEITDDNLFEDLMRFVQEKKLLHITAGAPKEEQPFSANKG